MSHVEGVKGYKFGLQRAHAIWDTVCGRYRGPDVFSFAPDAVIERYSISHRTELVREDLDNWIAFENCEIDWGYRDFERMALEGIDAGATVLLITDEGLMDNCVFEFCRAQFDEFAEWYEEEYKMRFFQSADYVVFDRDLKFLRVLHHDGALFRST